MTPIDRIAQLRDAFTRLTTALTDIRRISHEMEGDLLDWYEEGTELHAFPVVDEPTEPPAAHVEPETATPTEPTPEAVEPTPEPTEASPAIDHAPELEQEPEPVSLEQVRAKLAALSAAGHTAQIGQLIQARGVAKLSDVPAEEYAALLEEAEGIAA